MSLVLSAAERVALEDAAAGEKRVASWRVPARS